MFGNRLGWGISAVLVMVTVVLVYWLAKAGGISDPTPEFKADPAALTLPAIAVDPGTVVRMDQPGDAAPLYRDAIKRVQELASDRSSPLSKAFRYESFHNYTTSKMPPKDIEDAVREVADKYLVPATHLSGMKLFVDRPEELVNYLPSDRREALVALQEIGDVLVHEALLLSPKDKAKSTAYSDAVFALGAHLYAERLVPQELSVAARLMGGSSYMIAANDPERKGAAQAFTAAYKSWAQQAAAGQAAGPIERKRAFLTSIDPGIIAERAGDVFYVVQNGKERLWRVQGLLELGIIKFGSDKRGDRQGAARIARKFSDDPDPVVRAAAQAAASFREDQYHALR